MDTATSTQFVYFPEGGGFIFIRPLGEGGTGRVDLVRSIADGQLYARKEQLEPYMHVHPNDNEPSLEVAIARKMTGSSNISHNRGWARYEKPVQPQRTSSSHTVSGVSRITSVSYWDFCNAGSLQGLLEAALGARAQLPTQWVWSWLIDMMSATLDLHVRGICHGDISEGNMFIHRSSQIAIPVMILGDFGEAYLKRPRTNTTAERLTWTFSQGIESDWEDLITIFKLVNTQHECDTQLSELMTDLLQELDIHGTPSFGKAVKDEQHFTDRLQEVVPRFIRKARHQFSQLPLPPNPTYDALFPPDLEPEQAYRFDQQSWTQSVAFLEGLRTWQLADCTVEDGMCRIDGLSSLRRWADVRLLGQGYWPEYQQ